MKRNIVIMGLALLAAGSVAGLGTASAQELSGRVINAPWFDAGYRLMFSGGDRVLGTSRSAAMGGAFASLGADLSSMSINPAGLGMYQSSDWNFTQALSIDGMHTSAANMRPGMLSEGGSRVSYGFNNAGIVYNVFNGSGTLTSLSIGFGYNRLANFNSRTRIATFDEDSSIADMFARQLNFMADEGIGSSALNSSAHPFDNPRIGLDQWASVLGYHTGLAGLNNEGGYGYFNGALPSDNYFTSITKGGIYEYNFSLGANIGNVLYLGTTIGAAQIDYLEETSYEEVYLPEAMFNYMRFDQTTRIEGSGITAKFGAIIRPLPSLRAGVAFHLPTYYTVEKSYAGAMNTDRNRASTGIPLIDEQQFNSAPRLTAGLSGVIADRAIIALDWEVAWYNKIRRRNTYSSQIEESKAESELLYRPGHTLRAGLEILVSDVVSVRAGGSWMMDFMKKEFVTNNPTPRSGYTITAGVGFNIGTNGYLDLAYVYNRSTYTNYDFYYFKDGNGVSSQWDMVNGVDVSREYTPRRSHNMLTLTLGNRF